MQVRTVCCWPPRSPSREQPGWAAWWQYAVSFLASPSVSASHYRFRQRWWSGGELAWLRRGRCPWRRSPRRQGPRAAVQARWPVPSASASAWAASWEPWRNRLRAARDPGHRGQGWQSRAMRGRRPRSPWPGGATSQRHEPPNTSKRPIDNARIIANQSVHCALYANALTMPLTMPIGHRYLEVAKVCGMPERTASMYAWPPSRGKT